MTGEAQADKPRVLRDTDDEARRLARRLVRGARYVALAVLDPGTGFPSVSRALTGTDVDGAPVILVSALSSHTRGLAADPRCSLLAGEPGKGDPLAHPRITVQAVAEGVARGSAEHDRIRSRFLQRHSKAALYVDFPDFRFFRLVPLGGSLNGGFGQAYALTGSDLLIAEPGTTPEWLALPEQLNGRPGAATAFTAGHKGRNGGNWRVCGVDRAGLDLVCGDLLIRHEFNHLMDSPDAVLDYISAAAKVV